MRLSKISRKSVFYSLAAIAISNTLLQILGFLYRIFLSRMTGAEGLGVYQLVMPFYSVITSLTLTGLTVAVSRISASRAGIGDFAGARKAVSLSRIIFTVSVITLAVPSFFGARTIAEDVLGDMRTLPSIPFVFICLFLTGLENILKNYFYGVGRVAPQITSELSEQIIRALSVAVLLLTFRPKNAGVSAMLIVIGMVISELFSSSLLSLFFCPEKKRLSTHKKASPKVSEILSISIPVSAAATMNNLLSSVNSILVPRRLQAFGMTASAATEAFGVMFGMTMPLLAFPIAFIASLTSVMVPRISEGLESGNVSDMRRKAGKTIHSTSLLAMPCIAILIPLGTPLCRILFSHDAAGQFMLPLCIATLLSYYELTTGALLNGTGMQKQAAVYITIGGILQLAATWCIGLPHIGMRGFVFGYVISSAVTAVLNFICLIRRLKLRPRFTNWFFSPLLASVFAALICDIAYNFFLSHSIHIVSSLVLAALTGIFAYAIALSALGTNIVRYVRTLIPSGM